MKTEIKKRLVNFLENGGTYEDREELLKEMKNELGYVDIPAMGLSSDDLGCADLTEKQLEEVAYEMSNQFMEEFSEVLNESIERVMI